MKPETIKASRAFFDFAAHLGHGCGLVDEHRKPNESPLLKLARALRAEDSESINALAFTQIVDRGKGTY